MRRGYLRTPSLYLYFHCYSFLYLQASSLYLLQIANTDFATSPDGGEVITLPCLALNTMELKLIPHITADLPTGVPTSLLYSNTKYKYNGTETHPPYHNHHQTLLISPQDSLLHCMQCKT